MRTNFRQHSVLILFISVISLSYFSKKVPCAWKFTLSPARTASSFSTSTQAWTSRTSGHQSRLLDPNGCFSKLQNKASAHSWAKGKGGSRRFRQQSLRFSSKSSWNFLLTLGSWRHSLRLECKKRFCWWYHWSYPTFFLLRWSMTVFYHTWFQDLKILTFFRRPILPSSSLQSAGHGNVSSIFFPILAVSKWQRTLPFFFLKV